MARQKLVRPAKSCKFAARRIDWYRAGWSISSLKKKRMRKNSWILLAGIALVYACQPDKKEAQGPLVDLKSALPGTWETKYLQITMPTYQGGDSTNVFEASEEYWEARFLVKPYRTYFSPEQKYHTVHRGLHDELISESRGMWNTFGDTLLMVEEGSTIQYKLLIEKGQAHLSALLDWDQDGQEDDEYYMVYRLVSKSSSE